MIYLLPVLFLAMGGLGFYLADKTGGDAWHWLTGFGIGFSLIFVPLLPLWALSNGAGLAEWEAFYEANSRNYAIAVDETSAILSTEKYVEQVLIPVEGSIEKWRQGEVVSKRIVEWRDAVNEYNSTIASMKYYNRNIFTGVLVPDGVEDMKLLVIE